MKVPAPPPILHSTLPLAPWMDVMTARMPGLMPLGDAPWLVRDEVFAEQMALRDRLIAEKPGDVIAALPGSEGAQRELLEHVLAAVLGDAGYRRDGDGVMRPDGVRVDLSGPPLAVAGRLAQEDFALVDGALVGGDHVLVAACVCFPASWTLAQKIGRPMQAIHTPVARYDEAMGARIARVFAHLKPEAPVWRGNYLRYNDPALHQPRLESERRSFDPTLPVYVRVERQTLRKLPVSGAVVFSIHTYLAPLAALTPDQAATLEHV